MCLTVRINEWIAGIEPIYILTGQLNCKDDLGVVSPKHLEMQCEMEISDVFILQCVEKADKWKTAAGIRQICLRTMRYAGSQTPCIENS